MQVLHELQRALARAEAVQMQLGAEGVLGEMGAAQMKHAEASDLLFLAIETLPIPQVPIPQLRISQLRTPKVPIPQERIRSPCLVLGSGLGHPRRILLRNAHVQCVAIPMRLQPDAPWGLCLSIPRTSSEPLSCVRDSAGMERSSGRQRRAGRGRAQGDAEGAARVARHHRGQGEGGRRAIDASGQGGGDDPAA